MVRPGRPIARLRVSKDRLYPHHSNVITSKENYDTITVPVVPNNTSDDEKRKKPEFKIAGLTATKPVGINSRVLMTNKACLMIPEHQDAAQHTGRIFKNEQYENVLIEQYGFDPSEAVCLSPGREMFRNTIRVENSSQCANPTTTDTGTNGPGFEMSYDFGDGNKESYEKGFSPKNVEISNTPRLKVIADRYTRFKEGRIELRRLEERIICLEYDVYKRDDTAKVPAQVMRAYFCIKTGCEDCKGAFLDNLPYNIRPSSEKKNRKNLEKEVEIIDEKLTENKTYLQDLRRVLKKRQAMNYKKRKSTLDLNSLYNMAYHEMPPRDHDFSNTNLLSKAELEEVKHLIMKKCDSRVYNFSRKKMELKPDRVLIESTNGLTELSDLLSDSFCCNLLHDFSK